MTDFLLIGGFERSGSMKKLLLPLILIGLTVVYGQTGFQYYHGGNFTLQNGETIPQLRLAYHTFGKPNKDSSNVVLYPTWFGGNSAQIGRVLGSGGIVDTSHFFVIAVDALGNGYSSSPINQSDRADGSFPHFTIADMVRSQHRLLTRHFYLKNIHAVIGGSMGGMQTFEWLVRYPDCMQKAIPYVGTPRLTSHDMFLIKNQLNIIEAGWAHGVPKDSLLGMVSAIQRMMAYTPAYFVEHFPRDEMDQVFNDLYQKQNPYFPVENYAGQLYAMLRHDVALDYGGDMRAATARVQAQTLVIVCKQDHIVRPEPALEFARAIDAQTLVLDSPCGHLSISCEMDTVSAAIKQFLDKTKP